MPFWDGFFKQCPRYDIALGSETAFVTKKPYSCWQDQDDTENLKLRIMKKQGETYTWALDSDIITVPNIEGSFVFSCFTQLNQFKVLLAKGRL